MKTATYKQLHLIFFFTLLFAACQHSNPENDKATVQEVLNGETEFFIKKDFDNWARHWKQSPDIIFSYIENNSANQAIGWQELSEQIKTYMETEGLPGNPEFSRTFHAVEVDGNLAWAHFTQEDAMNGIPTQKTETRTLQRVDGEWKIIAAQILNHTTFEPGQTLINTGAIPTSTRIAQADFPKDKPINHIGGWGGMAVAINEMPAGTDLSPLLQGLPNNSCQVPHWGYIAKGAVHMKYDNGKEEVLSAGDVFYMPPGHTGVVEEDLKVIDFSPEEGFQEVAAHIEAKLAAMQ